MFDPRNLSQIAKDNQKCLRNLQAVEEVLNERFFNLSLPVRALILSVASGEPLLLIGPPGTAKSRLIRAFCGVIDLLNEDDPSADHRDYFEYLLTPFTEPGELFGYYDIRRAQQGELVRSEEHMMQQARVVYLDEVFNGSSAILNSILAFLNERIFHDRGRRKLVKMECLFAATNHVPETPELRAVFDRFVLRCHVDNVESQPEPLGNLLRTGWIETYGERKRLQPNDGMPAGDLLYEMERFRTGIRQLAQNGKLVPDLNRDRLPGELARIVEHARSYELSDMSNRRLVKILYLMVVHRVYDAVCAGRIDGELYLRREELALIPRYFLDRYEDEEAIRQLEGIASGARL